MLKKAHILYKIDDTFPAHPGCPCLGDQPKIGVDNNAVYLSVDEFEDWAAGGTIEDGADVFIISKPQMVAQVTANFTAFTNLTIGGIRSPRCSRPSARARPTPSSWRTPSPSWPTGRITPWPLPWASGRSPGDSNVTSGNFSAESINSESYAFPVLAVSTGKARGDQAPF